MEIVTAQRLRKHFHWEQMDVSALLGIQSQFLRYAGITARTRGISLDKNPERYFRAWTLRGTLHVHEIEDYGLFLHQGIASRYMTEYWNDASAFSGEQKAKWADEFLGLIAAGTIGKAALIEAMTQNGMTGAEKDYLFNPWGGMPRYLMEQGEILLTTDQNASYMLAPDAGRYTEEEALREQLARYIRQYAPCTVKDIMYFFKYPQRKVQRLLDELEVKPDHSGMIWGERPAATELRETYILSGFDPLLVGYEKKLNPLVSQGDLRKIFTLQGIIKPAIVHHGKIIGTWNTKNKIVRVDLFDKENGEHRSAAAGLCEQMTALTFCESMEVTL